MSIYRISKGVGAMTPSRQVMQGVQALHNHGITHMDLKPQNIMINCNGPSLAQQALKSKKEILFKQLPPSNKHGSGGGLSFKRGISFQQMP